jgi:hypothetical protein
MRKYNELHTPWQAIFVPLPFGLRRIGMAGALSSIIVNHQCLVETWTEVL